MAKSKTRGSLFTESMLEAYVGDFLKSAGKLAGGSAVVRIAILGMFNKDTLEKIQKGGKHAARATAAAFTVKLEKEKRISRASAEITRRGLDMFFDEFFDAIPTSGNGNVKTSDLLSAWTTSMSKVFRRLDNEDIKKTAPGTAQDKRGIMTNQVMSDLRAMASSDEEFTRWMTARTLGLRLLYIESLNGNIDAKVAFDYANFGTAAANHMFIAAVAGANDERDVVTSTIAVALNNTEKDYGIKRAQMVMSGMGIEVAHVAMDLVKSGDDVVKNWLAPYVEMLLGLAAKAQLVAWSGYVVCVIVIVYSMFAANFLLGWATSIVALVAMLVPFALSVDAVSGHVEGVKGAFRALHSVLSMLPGVPEPKGLPDVNLDDPDRMSELQRYNKELRWKALTAVYTLVLVRYAEYMVFENSAYATSVEWTTFVLYLVLLSVNYSILTKFQRGVESKSTPVTNADVDTIRSLTGARWALNSAYALLLVIMVLSAMFVVATRTPALYLVFGGVEVARDFTRYNMMQTSLRLLMLASVGTTGFLLWSLIRQGWDRQKVRTAFWLLVALVPLGALQDYVVQKAPPSAPLQPLEVWSDQGLEDPVSSGVVAPPTEGDISGSAGGGVEDDDPRLKGLSQEDAAFMRAFLAQQKMDTFE